MLSEYEAWVITHCRIKDVQPPYRPRRVAGPAAIVGLVLVGTLVLRAYERPRAIGAGPTGVFAGTAGHQRKQQCRAVTGAMSPVGAQRRGNQSESGQTAKKLAVSITSP